MRMAVNVSAPKCRFRSGRMRYSKKGTACLDLQRQDDELKPGPQPRSSPLTRNADVTGGTIMLYHSTANALLKREIDIAVHLVVAYLLRAACS